MFSFPLPSPSFFFFFNDTATTEIYTLSLHDALPICSEFSQNDAGGSGTRTRRGAHFSFKVIMRDRKSTRLNSSHLVISYAVFCLKKKKKRQTHTIRSHWYRCEDHSIPAVTLT